MFFKLDVFLNENDAVQQKIKSLKKSLYVFLLQMVVVAQIGQLMTTSVTDVWLTLFIGKPPDHPVNDLGRILLLSIMQGRRLLLKVRSIFFNSISFDKAVQMELSEKDLVDRPESSRSSHLKKFVQIKMRHIWSYFLQLIKMYWKYSLDISLLSLFQTSLKFIFYVYLIKPRKVLKDIENVDRYGRLSSSSDSSNLINISVYHIFFI